ncbi:hypothetical protein DNTS_000047, partial [Danionella cerebrum]
TIWLQLKTEGRGLSLGLFLSFVSAQAETALAVLLLAGSHETGRSVRDWLTCGKCDHFSSMRLLDCLESLEQESSCLMDPSINKSELPLSPEAPQYDMCLPLHNGDQNNITCASESSSLSSSSTSLLYDRGEASPDSIRSLSSLGSVRTESPLDVDMPEAEMGKGNSDDSGIQSPECNPDCCEDNENSISVYLDANDDGWSDNDNNNITMVVVEKIGLTDEDETSLYSSENDDEDNKEDKEENSFLSFASVDFMRNGPGGLLAIEVSISSDVEMPESLPEIPEEQSGDVFEVCRVVFPKIAEDNTASCPIIDKSNLNSGISVGDNFNGNAANDQTIEVFCANEESSVESIPETKCKIVTDCHHSDTEYVSSSDSSMLSKEDNQPKFNNQPEVFEIPLGVELSCENVTDEVSAEFKHGINMQNDIVATSTNLEANKESVPKEDTKTTASSLSKVNNKPKSPVKKANDDRGRAIVKATQTKPSKPEVKRLPRPELRNIKARIIPRPASASRSVNLVNTNTNVIQSGTLKIVASGKAEDKAVAKRSRSSSSHARGSPSADFEEKDTNTSFLAQGKETRKPCRSLAGSKTKGENQHVKDTREENPVSTNETISAREEHACLRTDRTSEAVVKHSHREVRDTSSVLAAGGRTLQSTGIPRTRSTEKPTVPSCPSPASSSPCKTPQRSASSKLPVKNLPTSPSCSSVGCTATGSSVTIGNKVEEALKSEKSLKPSPSSQSQGKSVVGRPVTVQRSKASPASAKPAVGVRAPAVTTRSNQNALQRTGSGRLNRSPPVTDCLLRKEINFPAFVEDTLSSCWTLKVMLWSPRLSLSNFHVKLTAKGLFRNLQLLPGCKKSTVVFHTVDKSSKGSKAPAVPPGRTAQHPPTSHIGPVEEEEERDHHPQDEKKNQCIMQLRKLIVNGNRRMEALALVVQHIFTERESAIKQREELSTQINNLREQLSNSVSCCEQLEREKQDVRVTLEALFQKLQDQHQAELQQLEENLRDFYSAEWDKTHEAYQREADKCRALMQQQVDDMRSKQEALRTQQEVAHSEQIAILKHKHSTSLADLRKCQKHHMQELENTLKQSEAKLNENIQTLTVENEMLKERIREEEEWRKAVADKSQKDAHTLYLEQELESLRAVLDIKTNRIHQQDKKLMQMDKLIDDNLKLEECLKKVQQENEDYKARMDKHAALSKQLSTEQAMLQQTLQKESKVNKRLSMENEELLWKLHNGDLCSPRRLSPTSPFPSPQNSASFSTPPVSPR